MRHAAKSLPRQRPLNKPLWLLPGSSLGITRYLPTWFTLAKAARDIVLAAVQAEYAEDIRTGRHRPKERLIPRTFGLLPCPDNEYDHRAIAVIVPEPGTGWLDMSHQVAWIKNDHLGSLRPSIIGLMEATGEPVGCRGFIRLGRYIADQDYYVYDDDSGDDDLAAGGPSDSGKVLTLAECRNYTYSFDGFRADIGSWEPVRDAVLAFAHERVRDRILPLISHRSGLTEESKPLRDDMRAVEYTKVLLRADNDTLDAYWHGTRIASLHPDPREFFARTHRRVLALGGEAHAQAVVHARTIEVFVEDSRFLSNTGRP